MDLLFTITDFHLITNNMRLSKTHTQRFNRNASWLQAQIQCESQNASLMRLDYFRDTWIRDIHFTLAEDFGEIMFLGMQKNEEVSLFSHVLYV